MAFTVPQMPLVCNIYAGPWLTKALRSSPDCNLAWGRRVQLSGHNAGDFDSLPVSLSQVLLLPALTDIRDGVQTLHPDIVECPAGSGRWYQVLAVDDIGKGFPNEHRGAVLTAISSFVDAVGFAGCLWPLPVP